MGQQVNVYRELKFFPGAIVTGWGAQGEGRTYYVNNITGSSTADGLSWNSAVSQVERAISLSETFRLLGGSKPSVTTNDYIRNTIIVQGTGTAYTPVASIPNYVDIIGLGADPRGNGSGIAVVSGAASEDAWVIDSNGCRGLSMYNMQLTAGATANWAMDIVKIFRSRFEGCVFTNSEAGGLRITNLAGGVVFDNCYFGADTTACAYGMYLGLGTGTVTGTNFNNCKVTNSEFWGTTSALYNSAHTQNSTRFDNNLFIGAAGGTSHSVQDTSNVGVAGYSFYTNNYGYGTHNNTIGTTFEVNDATIRCIGNIENATGVLFQLTDINND